MKKFFAGLLLAVLLTGSLALPPADAGVAEAVTYLEGQSQDAWSTQALVAAGVTSPTTSHLTSVSGTLATDYAKAILAVVAAGEDPKTFGNTNYVDELLSFHTDSQMGDRDLLNDDMWSIMALASVGMDESTEAQDAKTFLLNNQNNDGGWSWAVGFDSDTNDTAAAIMALLEVGLTQTSQEIVDAVAYLQSVQNADGGMPYAAGSDSDAGSDAWTITALNKVGVDASTWTQDADATPISHLESLQDIDGGYWWVPEGTSEFNNKAMTPFAVVALSGNSFPVAYATTDPEPQAGEYHLVIEGSSATICDAIVTGVTALDVVKNGADSCGYTYVIQDTQFGPYLSQINDDAAEGLTGWQYWVNFESALVGAADYTLTQGDEVLWAFGGFNLAPTRVSVDDTSIDSGESIELQAEYYNGDDWLILPDATVVGGDISYITNGAGKATIALPDGQYSLYVERSEFIRSNKVTVFVGEGVGQNVSMRVNVNQGNGGGGGGVGGDSIIFEVNPASINFGNLASGENSEQVVQLHNEGAGSIIVEALVSGDPLFTDNLTIDTATWADYQEIMAAETDKDATVGLLVPAQYLGSGVKIGEIIFWASSN